MIRPRLVEMWYRVGWMAWSVDDREQWDSTALGRITSCSKSSSRTFEPTQLKALRRPSQNEENFGVKSSQLTSTPGKSLSDSTACGGSATCSSDETKRSSDTKGSSACNCRSCSRGKGEGTWVDSRGLDLVCMGACGRVMVAIA